MLLSRTCNAVLFDEATFVFFLFKQKTAYEMRISDCSSDVCSSDLGRKMAAAVPPASMVSPRRRAISLPCSIPTIDRKSVVWGKSVSVRVDLGGRRIIKKKTKRQM